MTVEDLAKELRVSWAKDHPGIYTQLADASDLQMIISSITCNKCGWRAYTQEGPLLAAINYSSSLGEFRVRCFGHRARFVCHGACAPPPAPPRQPKKCKKAK